MPEVADPQWQTYLTTLAGSADDRRSQLGRDVAATVPVWAVEVLGAPPSPDEGEARSAWEERAASVAAYRELVGHDDEADALGPP